MNTYTNINNQTSDVITKPSEGLKIEQTSDVSETSDVYNNFVICLIDIDLEIMSKYLEILWE